MTKKTFISKIAISIILVFSISCKDKFKENMNLPATRYVNADGGLKIRTTPSVEGSIVTVVPYGATVSVIEIDEKEIEISNRKGSWSKIEWNDKKGWVFGGFLSNEIILTAPNSLGMIKTKGAIFSIPNDIENRFALELYPGGTFNGYCGSGHYGGGKIYGKWTQREDEETINLEGTADLEWNTDEQIKKSIKFSGLVELKQKENTFNIYSYTPIVPINKTPCETQIKDGTWISSEGVEVNYF